MLHVADGEVVQLLFLLLFLLLPAPEDVVVVVVVILLLLLLLLLVSVDVIDGIVDDNVNIGNRDRMEIVMKTIWMLLWT